MANINIQNIGLAGASPVYTACAAGGDAVQTGNGVLYHFKNTSAGAITVTAVTQGTVQGLAIADRALVVPATGELFVTLSPQFFADGPEKRASLTYSAVAGLSVAAFVH